MVGWTDLPADLSDADSLARLSAHLPQNATLVSSDLIRATATADALATKGRHRLPHNPALREIHFGAWEMCAFAQIEAEAPDLIRAFWETPGDIRPPGGESWNDVLARISLALDHLPQGDVIVVCHFGAILAALQLCLGLTAAQAFSHRIDNLSVTDLHHDGAWRLGALNHRP